MDRKLKVLGQIDLISHLFYIVSDHIYSQFLEISENRELTVNIVKPQLKLKV